MIRKGSLLPTAAALVLLAGTCFAAEPQVAQHLSGAEKFNPQADTIRLFEGIASGSLAVRVTTDGPHVCRLRITNTTDSPLNVVMPGAFAAVPVLNAAEEQEPPMEDQPPEDPVPPEGDDLPPPEDPQKLGIGCPFAGGSEAETFSFVPGRAAHLQLRAICLEHDRPGPQPNHRYEVRPMSEVTHVKGVYEICAMMGRGEIDHKVAQVAAWHLNNRISWRQIWNESQHGPEAMGGREGMSQRQLFEAIEAVEKAVNEAWTRVTSLLWPAAQAA